MPLKKLAFLTILILFTIIGCYSPVKEIWYTGMWYRRVVYMDHDVESPIFYVEEKHNEITMYSNTGIYDVFKDKSNDEVLHMEFYLKKNFISKYNFKYKGGGKVEARYYKKRWREGEPVPDEYTYVESIVYNIRTPKKGEVKSWKKKKRIKLKSVQ